VATDRFLHADEGSDIMSISLHPRRASRRSNEALAGPLNAPERASMIAAATRKMEELFDILLVDHCNDHNTRDTPGRVARMLVDETMAGRFTNPPAITSFDNAEAFEGLIVTGPIELRSTCAHHMMPIYGHVCIGIMPAAGGQVIGLSKYDRIVDHFAARLQIQEELVQQIGQHIIQTTAPHGLAVRISAVHMCKTHRGVHASHRSRMVTNAWFGAMATDRDAKAEFLRECATLERSAA
jgi:GTP cyclohydrolase I